MARKRAHLTGIGAAVVLALVMAGDPSGGAESAAPEGIAAKPKEKVAEKVAEKTPEKGPAKTLADAAIRIPLPRPRPQPGAAAGRERRPACQDGAPGPPRRGCASGPEPGYLGHRPGHPQRGHHARAQQQD